MAKTAAAPKAATPAAADAPKKANALAAPVKPSPELAAIVGDKPLPRTQVIKKVWDYIKEHKLQNPAKKTEIKADAKLKKVFGVDAVTMFEMNKHISKHLTKA